MKWAHHWSIKKRLIGASAILVAIFLAYGLFSLWSMARLGDLTSLLYEHPLRVSNAALRANTGIIKMHRSMKDVTLARSRTEVVQAMQDLREEEQIVLDNLAIVDRQILGEEGRTIERETHALVMAWRPIRAEVLELVDAGRIEEAALITKGRGADHVRKIELKMQELNAYARNKADGFMANAKTVDESTRWASIAAILLVIFAAGSVTLLLTNSILSALNRLRGTMAHITETGQLEVAPAEGKHEIADMARHFNGLVETLQVQFDYRDRLNLLSQELTALKDRTSLAEVALNLLARQVGACAGAVYLIGEDGDCVLEAGFARVEQALLADRYRIGESLVGQVAKERAPLLLTGVPAGEALAVGGTSSGPTKALYAVPLQHEEDLLGVLEVGAFNEFTPETLTYLNAAADVVAILLSSSQKEQQIHQLLASTQEANQLLETRGREIAAANAELTHANKELKTQAQELAAQSEELLAQKMELERQRSKVAETDRLKSEFLSNMSHELRTPLNSILALSQLILSRGTGVDPDKEHEYLGVIERNGRHLLGLINDILDLSKIEAGRMELELSSLAPLRVIHEAVQTVQPLAEEKGVPLVVDSEDLPEIVADEDKLRQILLNLLANAVKFTSAGHIRLSTHTDAETIVFTVEDSGIGIPPDELPHIFDQFRQVDGATTRRYEGSGLGLAICQRLAEMMGGLITVESEEGGGSTFTLRLPLQVPAPSETHTAIAPTSRKERPHRAEPAVKGRLVLVVDDERDIRRTLSQFLEGAGYQVATAANGQEALQLAKTLQPDCMTLDILMPDMDGWEVIRQLKADARTCDIPVVIVSLSDDQETGYALGASGYLLKPIDRNLLLSTLNHLAMHHRISRVLVVDDDPVVREQLEGMLAELDYTVETASGGEEGLSRLDTVECDAVILDLMMPEVDGFGVIERMKADPSLRDIPIVILSAKDLSARDRVALQQNVHQIIDKGQMERPVFLEKLATTLSELMRPTHRSEILVVEDNEVAQLQIQTALEGAGYRVRLVDNGTLALDELVRQAPDAIVVDLMMPGMDGFEVIHRLRELEQGKDLPILVLTAKDMTDADLEQLAPHAISRLVQKGSLNRDQLIECVENLLIPGTVVTMPETPLTKMVLVVEDNPDNRLTIEALLDEGGYSYQTLVDGQGALQKARELRPGVVLMDMQLPDIDGLELTRQIKADEALTGLPVVALTAKAMQGDRETILAEGCDDYLSKPLDPKQLYDTLDKWLHR